MTAAASAPDEPEVRRGVAVEAAARGSASPSAQPALQLAEPLAGGHEQGAEAGDDEEPARDRELGRDAAGDRAQQEAHGQQGELDDRLVLEEQRVGEGERCVGEHDAEEADVDRQGEASDADGEHGRGEAAPRRESSPAAIGPGPLDRVPAIGLDVADVVDQVGGTRHQAEGDEGEQRRDEDVRLEERAGRQRRGEDEDVLQPLPGAHGDEQRGGGGPVAGDGLTHRGRRTGPARSRRRSGRSGAPRGTTSPRA